MAKEETEEAVVEQPKGKGKKFLIIIISVVLLLVLVGGGAAVYLLTSTPAAEQHDSHEEEAAKDDHPPIYEKLDSFTTRLADGESYLQCEINLKVADAKVQEKIKVYMPEIKDGILRLLASQNADELATVEGKDKLAQDVQKTVNDILGVKAASAGVQKVLFPAFIIQ